ncbi:4-hydroxybenzoate octaprenyltransferase [Glacieibacterium sp.]|uniref:4-hydroxybenzoate octaprenyltransferase n=1 Tax=Glacieibacterium sp. TaxID=2860237 RepID=UPI003AFFEC24
MTSTATPDAETRPSGWVELLPPRLRDFARLARFDRPIGTWLLFWPCAWGLALAGGLRDHWPLLLWFGLGSVAMRGAGCVYNDIVDRDLDARVERTRDRPLASGRVTARAAWAWLVMLALAGLVVLLQLRWQAQVVALGSLALVAAYPFMKRITWWPQAWLGLTFNWGIPVAWVAVAEPGWALAALYAAGIAWTLGYDTIYALQDIEDDAMAGIKSSARALGDGAQAGVALFYVVTIALLAAAIWLAHPDYLAFFVLAPAALHLAWQVAGLGDRSPANALRLFRSNRTTGLLVFAGLAVVGLA